MKILSILAKKLLKNRNQIPLAVRYFRRKPELVSNTPQLAVASHKCPEKYNEQKVFNKTAVLKTFAIFTRELLCQRPFLKLKCKPSGL